MNNTNENVNPTPEQEPKGNPNQTLLIFRQEIRNKYIQNESDRTPVYLLQNNACYSVLNRYKRTVNFPENKIFTFDAIVPELISDQKQKESCLFPKGLSHGDFTCSPVIILYNDNQDKRLKTVQNILLNANVQTFLQDAASTSRIITETNPDQVQKEIDRQYSDTFSGKAYIEKFKADIEQAKRHKAVSTGYPILDKCLDGGFYSGLYALGGGTGTGKTTLMLNIADHIARKDHHVLVIALEMSREELFAKMISNISYSLCEKYNLNANTYSQKTRDIFKGGKPDESKEDRYIREQSINDFAVNVANNIFIKESVGNLTVEQIRSEVEEHIRHTGKTPVLIVDYLQILGHSDKYLRTNDKAKTDSNVVALKQLSRDFNLPVFLISSLNRESYKDITQEVNLTSFKESGSIEYSCDVVLGLQLSVVTDIAIARGNGDKSEEKRLESTVRDEIRAIPKRMDIKILKNRHGENNGIVRYCYYPNFNHFGEIQKVRNEKTEEQKRAERKKALTSFED